MLPKITKSVEKIKIAAFTCEKIGKVAAATIDLTPYAGQHVRVWLDMDGSYSLDPRVPHFWQMAEFDVPEIQYQSIDTGEVDDQEAPIMISEALPLDLAAVEIAKWELSE